MRKKIENKVENFFLWKWLLGAERTVMVLCSIAVLLTIFAGVICRRVLGVNFTSSEELLVIFALWLYFIGGVEGGNYRDDHIKADVLSVFVKKETTIPCCIYRAGGLGLAVFPVLPSRGRQNTGAEAAHDVLPLCAGAGLYAAGTV